MNLRGGGLTQLGNEAFGGVAFTIIFGRAVLVDNRFWHQGNHRPLVRMDQGRAQHLVVIRDRPVAVDLLETGGAVNCLGGKILRPVEGQQVVIIQEHHRFQRLATLELSKDAFEQRTHRFGGDGIEYLTHLRVARHVVNRVDGPQVPFDPVLVESQQRWRFEGKQGKGRHERIR
jgi:hypothetical protein